eukprot:TRINITY_DN1988_c0_g1_i7.p2 TRINITY_DN1988_c0_g1~~TRINITY_DN1988_c0_g1_i7.p2  ORF type:complete len:377 (-),score=31.72 TRINITY_DN1988_c0_g1_i7:120-1250(-)
MQTSSFITTVCRQICGLPLVFLIVWTLVTHKNDKFVTCFGSSNPAMDLQLNQYDTGIRVAINRKNIDKLESTLSDLREELDGNMMIVIIEQISNPLRKAFESSNKKFGLQAGELLLRHGFHPQSMLNVAAERGLVDWIKLLVRYGAKVVPPGGGGVSPLMLACMRGHKDAVILLLQYGADIFDKNYSQGRSSIFYAAFGGNYKIVETLLELGADPSEEDYVGYTPLIDAVSQNHTRVVQLLLAWGANVNPPNLKHNPLHSAIENEQFQICQMLIKAGANIELEIGNDKLLDLLEKTFGESEGKTLVIDYYRMKVQNLSQELVLMDEKHTFASYWLRTLIITLIFAIIAGAILVQSGSGWFQQDFVLHITSFQFQNQ